MCYEARPELYLGFPEAPSGRVMGGAPFEIAGADFTGDITVRGDPDSPPIKIYMLI